MNARNLRLPILLISAVGIAYQIALMRIFSVAQWYHFAYMVIGIAMLGFGASGTLLALLRARVGAHGETWLCWSAFLAMFSPVGCYILSQKVPFETFQLLSDQGQFGYLLLLYVILAVPFFLVSGCITLALLLESDQIARLYSTTMIGSGLGAAGAVALLYVVPPEALPYYLSLPLGLAHLLLVRKRRWGILRAYGPLLLFGMLIAGAWYYPIRVSEYKGLSYALRLPDARIIAQVSSPMSVVTAVESNKIRETPGQISNYPMSEFGPLPEQIALFFDAGAVSPVNRFDGDPRPLTFLDYVTSALPYHLVQRPRVLVIGAGGGGDVLSALWHGAPHVTAAEVDPEVLVLMNSRLRDFSGGLYQRGDVTSLHAEGRGFLQSRQDRYDLIQLPLFGSFTAAAAGVMALNENYLYTVEAFRLYLSRLSETGLLSVTCWLKTPPRDAIKLLATAVEALRQSGARDPGRHLVLIRCWNTATLVVSRAPLDDAQVQSARAFCRDRGFDMGYCPGVEAGEVNRYTVLDRPIYYEAAVALLSSDAESFYRDYVFYVRPATDDRPYFFRFFKWSAAPRLLRGMRTEWIPFVEWGYVALAATLVQAVVASVALILVPLAAFGRGAGLRGIRGLLLVYFGGLGTGYMFLEIAFIQRLMLFLSYPVYAVAVVLTAFMVFSGLGSLAAGRWRSRPVHGIRWAVTGMAILAVAYLIGLGRIFEVWAGWPDAAKIALSVFLLAPLAFCMGIPFPLGLQLVADRWGTALPWAWGVNGCASVVGATLATLTAIHLGFRVVVLLSLLVYAVCVLGLDRLASRQRISCAKKPFVVG